MPRPRLPGCTSCRERHLRCDRTTPACSNCAGAKYPRKCVYGDLKIRHSTYSAKYQEKASDGSGEALQIDTHSSISPRLPRTVERHGGSTSAESPAACSMPFGATQSPDGWFARRDSLQAQQPLSVSTPGQVQSSSSTCVSSCAWEPRGTIETGQTPNIYQRGPSGIPPASAAQICCASHIQRTITSPLEKRVFEFYLENAGPWLDIVSSQQHFGRTVPQLALKEPVLYYACLAYASHLLLLHGLVDEYVSEQFQDEAISILIPLLSPERGSTPNAVLLSTAVILRMSEQFSELREDAQYHLHGAFSLFTTAQEKWVPASIDVRGVAFWTYVRESIRVCFLNEEGFQFNLDMIDGSIAKTAACGEEEAWTNHMSYLLSRLCTACWGDLDPEQKSREREQVRAEIDQWQTTLPETFQPWYHGYEECESFSEIKFMNSWHEIAWQQFYTAKVMLAIYGFRRPVSADFFETNQYLVTEILDPARLACSVCFSSNNTGCKINGSHLVAWCGQFFTGKEEQRLVANFLKTFKDVAKWPNQTCYERLQQIWNGKRSTWIEP